MNKSVENILDVLVAEDIISHGTANILGEAIVDGKRNQNQFVSLEELVEVARGKKIQAVRLYRLRNNVSLLESKRVFDQVWEIFYASPALNGQRGGNGI